MLRLPPLQCLHVQIGARLESGQLLPSHISLQVLGGLRSDMEVFSCRYEDRRPASNMDPYLVTMLLTCTTLQLPLPMHVSAPQLSCLLRPLERHVPDVG